MECVTIDKIKEMAASARDALWADAKRVDMDNPKIYLHWSAGHYGQFFDDYHINIDSDGSIYISTHDLSEVLSHTFGRNTGSVSISLACGAGANTENLGDEPPTNDQIESMAKVIKAVAEGLWLTINKECVLTHGEAADNEDGVPVDYSKLNDGDNGEELGMYGPQHTCERWDLEYLGTADSPSYNPSATDGTRGGDVLRGKALWYQQQEG